jgi:hypothetical protein
MAHNPVVSFIKTPIFIAKEYLHRKPDSSFDWSFVEGAQKDEASRHVEKLREDGITLIPGYFQGKTLEVLQAAFARTVDGKGGEGNPDAHVTTDVMDADPSFLNAALDDFILEIVGGYYQKKFSVGRASAMRLLPSPTVRYGSYQWHHDARGRQVHLMILLSDVSSAGQKMTYLKQSQNTYYTHSRGLAEGSRFEKDINSSPDLTNRIVDVVGPAGTVAIFDANGLHSGNRSLNEGRDTLTFCYVTVRHFKKLRYSKNFVDQLPKHKQDVVKFNPHCEQV